MKFPSSVRARIAAAGTVAVAAAVALSIGGASAAPTTHTFSTTLAKGTTVQVTPNGLVHIFTSPNNQDISVGNLSSRDGYELCDPTHKYYETGVNGSAGFGAATTSGSGNTFKVIRTTTDGRYTLTQKFTFIPSARRVSIAMTIKNLTNAPIAAIGLRRYSDFDVDTWGPDGFRAAQNYWARTRDAVIAYDDDSGASVQNSALPQPHGMMLSGEDNPIGREPVPGVVQTVFNTNCIETGGSATPVLNAADKAAELYYHVGAIYPGQSVTYTVAYQRI